MQNLGIDIMKARNMHRFRSLAYLVGSGFNIVVSLCLVWKWQELGVAFGTCAALTVFNVFLINWYYQKKVGLDVVLFWKDMALLFVKTAFPLCLCAAGTILWPVDSLPAFFAYGIAYSVLYAVFLYGLGLNAEERAAVRERVGRRSV